MKILWLTNIPSPYRVDFFNLLGEKCELTVLFERKRSSERNADWIADKFRTFKGIFLSGLNIDVDKALSFTALRWLKKGKYDHIVISNYATPTGIIAILWLKVRKIAFMIEGDGGFAKNGRGVKEKIKRYLIKSASGYFSSGKICDNYFINYGGDISNIYRYHFSSITKSNIKNYKFVHDEKDNLRKALGFADKKLVLSVGQFIPRKGFDILLKSLRLTNTAFVLIIIGGGDGLKEYKKIISDLGLQNVIIYSFMKKEDLEKYYLISDIFVLATREDIWGLVINEAMAHGLPVITTDRCIAGLELIRNGENGYIVPANNEYELAVKIDEMLSSSEKLGIMAKESLKAINKYTIEQMVEDHLKFFDSKNNLRGIHL